jgi:hypothetical protein
MVRRMLRACLRLALTRRPNEGTGRATWPFDRARYLLLSLAVGGDWRGQQGIDDASSPRALLVDWVRVYRR